jgi:hypothetical protein
MIDGFPSNSFTDRLLADVNSRDTIKQAFDRMGVIVSFDLRIYEKATVIVPSTFRDCLLFVGLNVKEALNNETLPVKDGKYMYYYRDCKLVRGFDVGYEVCYQVLPENRLSLGYCGPVFREYRERVLCLAS